eukprot:SAG22_NODE_1272_length_4923_cov_3.681385_1_plen_20_part_10
MNATHKPDLLPKQATLVPRR